MIAYGKQRGYRRFTIVCRETENPDSFVHLRHFAPANGIPEDPVTGTAHGVAAVYLDREGLLPPGERVVLVGEQGRAIDRTGEVTVEVRRQAGRIGDVRIGGTAVIAARGELMVRMESFLAERRSESMLIRSAAGFGTDGLRAAPTAEPPP
jgi:PhzF family phenazine biosynthesis protein